MATRRLSTKLTITYGGLFCLAMLVIACACYFAVVAYARTEVQRTLMASSSVFTRIWSLKSDTLRTNAVLLARDFSFKSALASGDTDSVDAAFATLRDRLGADIGIVVGPDGAPEAGERGELGQHLAQGLSRQEVLGPRTGIVAIDGKSWQTVAAPVLAPDLLGWVAFGFRLDETELQGLQGLSAIPLHGHVLSRVDTGDWGSVDGTPAPATRRDLGGFIERNLDKGRTGVLHTAQGEVIATVTKLPSLDSETTSVLLLTYPLKSALKAYEPLLRALTAIGALGLAFVVGASLYLAGTLTRPLKALADAAGRLKEGHAGQVEVTSEDEMAEVARAFNAMSISISEREREVLRMAKLDTTTSLPNRSAFADDINRLRERHGHQGMLVACIGVKRYNHIRAIWGVASANTLMVRLSDILHETYPQAHVARVTPDTLGVVICPCPAQDVTPIACGIVDKLDNRVTLSDDQSLDVMVGVGVYHVPKARPSPDEMIERALIALDQAATAKSRIAVFDPRIYSEMADTLLLTEQLHGALQDKVMSVFYQPKYSYREGRIAGAEALVRWNHPERGMVSPQRFVTIAEETGYIRDLTLQVMQTTLADQRRLKAEGFDLKLSINYSGRLLSDEAFNAQTLDMLKDAAGQICLEITETAVIEDPKVGLAAIDTFVSQGIEISIDDFGTGLSSLAYLKQIPARELKIDRAFVKEIDQGQRNALLVRSTIDLAHGLGMSVTAEGVETGMAFSLLQTMGCDQAQGYGIARPMPFDQVLEFLRDFENPGQQQSLPPEQRLRKSMV